MTCPPTGLNCDCTLSVDVCRNKTMPYDDASPTASCLLGELPPTTPVILIFTFSLSIDITPSRAQLSPMVMILHVAPVEFVVAYGDYEYCRHMISYIPFHGRISSNIARRSVIFRQVGHGGIGHAAGQAVRRLRVTFTSARRHRRPKFIDAESPAFHRMFANITPRLQRACVDARQH